MRKKYIKDKFGKVTKVVKIQQNRQISVTERYRIGKNYLTNSKIYGRRHQNRRNLTKKKDIHKFFNNQN